MSIPPIKIAPSLLSADFGRLGDQVAMVEKAGAEWLHVDVMDGHFVPNITLGPFIVRALKGVATRPLDCHLMITDPDTYAPRFADAGADSITVHVESEGDTGRTLDMLRDAEVGVGLTLSPPTDFAAVRPHLDAVDLLLVMTVHPGFGGQSFMAENLDKVRAARDAGFTGDIQVDGGVGPETAGACTEAGANVFVAGSAIFGADDPPAALQAIRAAAEAGREG